LNIGARVRGAGRREWFAAVSPRDATVDVFAITRRIESGLTWRSRVDIGIVVVAVVTGRKAVSIGIRFAFG
jgi:hypothetical protein